MDASVLEQTARDAMNDGRWLECARAYEQLLALIPDGPRSAIWWYDAALAYKFLRDWPKAYELGIEAAARSKRGTRDPAFWNLGIAATVLRDWTTARDAWTGYGLNLTPGTGPIEERYGRNLVRITAGDGYEVVWAQRLCPTRARVLSVPFHPSRRHGEVVVHDGEPTGERIVDGRTYTVFDELLLFEASDVPTVTVTIEAGTSADVDALHALVGDEHDLGIEMLSSAQLLCSCCSVATIEQVRDDVQGGQHNVLIAAPVAQVTELMEQWRTDNPAGRSWRDLHVGA